MSILKLPNAGDSATLDITGCERVEGEYGLQVKFTAGDDILFLPVASADRQLERIGVDYSTAIGSTLRFSRAPSSKPGAKPFWNIDTVKKNGKPPVASHSNVPDKSLPPLLQNAEAEDNADLKGSDTVTGIKEVPQGSVVEKPKMRDAYKSLTEWVIKEIAPLYSDGEFGMPPEVIASCTATLFIQACKAGKVE